MRTLLSGTQPESSIKDSKQLTFLIFWFYSGVVFTAEKGILNVLKKSFEKYYHSKNLEILFSLNHVIVY